MHKEAEARKRRKPGIVMGHTVRNSGHHRRSSDPDFNPSNLPVNDDSFQHYVARAGNHVVLSREAENRAFRAYKNAATEEEKKQHLDFIVRHNQRLIIAIVTGKYIRTVNQVPLIDLVNEGNIGMIRAIEKFEPERGFKFSTYATWWIKQACDRAIANNGRHIRTPVHVYERLKKLKVAIFKYSQLNDGDVPTDEWLAANTNLTVTQVKEALESPLTQSWEGLFESRDDEEPSPANRSIEPRHHDDLDYVEDDDAFYRVLERLLPKQQELLRLRFGLGDCEPHTYEAIGQMQGLTRERIRQKVRFALKAFRAAMPAHYDMDRFPALDDDDDLED